MGKRNRFFLLALAFILSGCVVRTYQVTKDRVDQQLAAGNRGYLKGRVSPAAERARKTTRTTQVVEVELHSPIKFEKAPKVKSMEIAPVEEREDRQVLGNRGYIMQSEAPEILEAEPAAIKPRCEKYAVRKGDTLQKISQQFYGTTKKWNKIYEANKGALKGPDKIYPGQTINVPVEELKEPKENLK